MRSGSLWAVVLEAVGAQAVVLALASGVAAQQTVGLFVNEPEAFPGYTLFTPLWRAETYLIDNGGRVVHEWPGSSHAMAYLLDDGDLLRTVIVPPSPVWLGGPGGLSGRVERLGWDGELEWRYTYSSDQYVHHHDIEPLPNGNVLMIAWEWKTLEEAVAAGRDPALLGDGYLWPDHVIEVQPTGQMAGEIVWEWHVWDHLVQDFDASKANFGVVAERPELVDLNFVLTPVADWNHLNAIAYDAELDQIAVTSRTFSEIWIIDHSTTTAEAAGSSGGRYGRGGDLLYRWGNPRAYRHGASDDQQLFYPHDVAWVDSGAPGAGNLTVFNNGPRPQSQHSSVDELVPPLDGDGSYVYAPGIAYGPTAPVWSYTASPETDLYARIMSGASRLPNGNTLVCDGPAGTVFEVTSDGRTVWRYVNPVFGGGVGRLSQGEPIPNGQNSLHRARRYAPDHPGLAGRDLAPRGPLELYVLLRNADIDQLEPVDPPLATLFTGTDYTSLDRARDEHVRGFAAGDSDDEPEVCGGRPLLLYQVDRDTAELKVVEDGACSVRIDYQ